MRIMQPQRLLSFSTSLFLDQDGDEQVCELVCGLDTLEEKSGRISETTAITDCYTRIAFGSLKPAETS